MPRKTSKKPASVGGQSRAKAARSRKPTQRTQPSNARSASERIDELIASLRDWRGKRLAEIRRLVHEVDREVVEEWKWMGTPVWSHEGMYALANAHKDKVKLTFFHGARLSDPRKLFNAGLSGNKWRAIDWREGDPLDAAGLRALLREAVAFNTEHRVPKSKGSRAAAPARGTAQRKAPAAGAKPKLLSGGNPQIAKADGDAPVQAYIAAMPGWKRDVGRRLDALIARTVPGVRKAVRWNTPFYGVEGQGWFLGVHCMTKYVKVAFLNGASLRPPPPIASKIAGTRYVHVHEHEPLDEKLVASWVRQAAKLPGERLF